MEEADWLVSTNPEPMLEVIRARRLSRKARLLAIACCETVEPLLTPEAIDLLRVCEAYADGLASKHDLARYRNAAKKPEMANQGALYLRDRGSQAALRAAIATAWENAGGPEQVVDFCVEARRYSTYRQALMEFANLIRCIFGNPFQPVSFDPRWRTEDVLGIARGIYEERAFDRLPILADALMDACCDNEDIVAHCKSEGPHARGCWVVDGALGKE